MVWLPNNWTQLIKQIARQEREASRPCDVVFGRVVSVSPLAVQLEQKGTLPARFLVLSATAVRAGLAPGDAVLVLRKSGGQRYIVLDKIEVTT